MRSGSYNPYVAVGLSDPICRVAGGRQPAHPDRADTHCDTTRDKTTHAPPHDTHRDTHTHTTTYQSSHSVQLYCGLCSRTPRLSGAPKYLLLAMARGHSRGAHGVQNCRALSYSLVGSPLFREVMRSPRNRHMPCQPPPSHAGHAHGIRAAVGIPPCSLPPPPLLPMPPLLASARNNETSSAHRRASSHATPPHQPLARRQHACARITPAALFMLSMLVIVMPMVMLRPHGEVHMSVARAASHEETGGALGGG